MDSPNSSFPVKILVIGNSGVGKTSLCNRYIDDKFERAYKPTIGVEFCSKEFVSKQKNKFNFQFWDIGGQDRFIYMAHVYYKNSDFCFIMFDLMNRKSFEACAKWKLDLDEKYSLSDGTKCPCLLIGNKCDQSENRILDQVEIEDFCEKFGFYGYMEMSVKNNVMVKETIDYISNLIMEKKEKDMKAKNVDILINKDIINLNYDDKLKLDDRPGCLSHAKPNCCRI